MKNEYLLTPYKEGKAVGDTEYIYERREAIERAKRLVNGNYDCDEVDLQVIYDRHNSESELSDIWWSITANGTKKYDGKTLIKSY